MLSKDKKEAVLVILPNVSRGSPQTVAGKIGQLNNTQIPAIPREAEAWKLLMVYCWGDWAASCIEADLGQAGDHLSLAEVGQDHPLAAE